VTLHEPLSSRPSPCQDRPSSRPRL
jgi:hypothetical protein